MDIIHRTDEALLDAASRTNGMLRDLLGVDQWKGARVLAHVYLALLVCSQLAMTHERGFAWGNMLILGTWIWHYATTVSGIDRYSRSANGSSMARIVERPSRSIYPFMLAGLALVVECAGVRPSGLLMLAGWSAIILAHYLKAAKMPPARRRDSTRLAFAS